MTIQYLHLHSNLCRNSRAVRLLILVVVSSLVLEATSKALLLATTSSHGNAVLLVLPLLGNSVVVMIVADMIPVTLLQPEELHLGPEIVAAEATTVATLIMEVIMAMARPQHLLLPHGNKPLPIRLVLRLAGTLATLHLDMAQATKETWVPLRALLHPLD